jgi:3-phosphoshikimate 1-carboxyvinyltransferase
MQLTIFPGNPLAGELASPALPGDKSISHRALLFAGLADGESRVENLLVSGVTRAMLNALTALGIPWRLEGVSLAVHGRGLRGFQPPSAPLDCGNSATTLRLLAGALAASGVPAVLDGSPGLRRRPMRRISEPLHRMGVPITASPQGTAPLRLDARPADRLLRPLEIDLTVASAQVKSCLLLAALAAGGPTTLREPGPSRDHTETMLRQMGVRVETTPGPQPVVTLTPDASRQLRPLHMSIPGDMSAAAFLIVAALITPGSHLVLRQVGLNPTRTGLLDALRQMGADIEVHPAPAQGSEPVGDLVIRHSRLRGGEVRGDLVVRMIDELPVFAVAAACAEGVTRVSDAQELRHKESDRIAELCRELSALGVSVTEHPDGMTIAGGAPIHGGQVDPHGDHRLAMSLAVAGLVAETPLTIDAAEIMAESYPNFPAVLVSLGARLEAA